jgi:hypothetical protein
MALFSQNMLQIAMELARERPTYESMAKKFVEHFLWIAASMVHAGGFSTTFCGSPTDAPPG